MGRAEEPCRGQPARSSAVARQTAHRDRDGPDAPRAGVRRADARLRADPRTTRGSRTTEDPAAGRDIDRVGDIAGRRGTAATRRLGHVRVIHPDLTAEAVHLVAPRCVSRSVPDEPVGRRRRPGSPAARARRYRRPGVIADSRGDGRDRVQRRRRAPRLIGTFSGSSGGIVGRPERPVRPSRSGGSQRPDRALGTTSVGRRPDDGTGTGCAPASRCSVRRRPEGRLEALLATPRRTAGASRWRSQYPAERRKNASRESGSHLRSWTPGRISVWSPAHSLGPSSDRNAFAYGSSRIWSLWRWMTPADQPIEIGHRRGPRSGTARPARSSRAATSRRCRRSRTNVSGSLDPVPPATIVVSSGVRRAFPQAGGEGPGSAIRACASGCAARRHLAAGGAIGRAGRSRCCRSVAPGRQWSRRRPWSRTVDQHRRPSRTATGRRTGARTEPDGDRAAASGSHA